MELNTLGLRPSSNTLQSLTPLGYGPINLKLGVFNERNQLFRIITHLGCYQGN